MIPNDETKTLFEPVLKWLDDGAPHKKINSDVDFGFNMDFFTSINYTNGVGSWIASDYSGDRSCGAVCCIAGAINQFNRLMCDDIYNLMDGMPHERKDLKKLFFPENSEDYEKITPQEAAAVIRNWFETGEVVWNGWDEGDVY